MGVPLRVPCRFRVEALGFRVEGLGFTKAGLKVWG